MIYRRQNVAQNARLDHDAYRSSMLRAPARPLIPMPHTLTEITGPLFGQERVGARDTDLTAQHAGPPIGQKIVVSGRVLDEDGRAVPHALIEVWQANAGGRYFHARDDSLAPLDPNFTGGGRCVTDGDGRYRFTTIRPGAYPWRNHPNAWRPAHIHFSLFGPSFVTRLITQMYFPGDPLLPFDPILGAIPDVRARNRLVSTFDLDSSVPGEALAFAFDLVLRGRQATPKGVPDREH